MVFRYVHEEYTRDVAIEDSMISPMLPVTVAPCVDGNDQCAYWAVIGECEANPRFMLEVCRASCHVCAGDEGRPLCFLDLARFLSEEECEVLKTMAAPHLHDAKTINRTTGASLPDKVRTNSQMYFDRASHYQDPVVAAIQHRMQVLARIPPGHSEPLQVGRYREGEFYQPHYDSEPAQNVRRAATVLVYLDPPEAGGETIFPKHRRCQEADFEDCCSRIEELVVKEGGGFAVKAKTGTAILFFSHDLDGQHNPLSMHASCPVLQGEKWVAQQWFRLECGPWL
ncbi:P4H1 [Symbiodinium natans]|uniref:P4H1 protein n=1 Tax=Symbiodinium natans TaxID=878477 RepID=A0A812P8S3_9DINO|nr:P4H1 [Symbiodinium natans]